jgi:hypothetical protein
MSWSSTRRFIYGSMVVAFFALLISPFVYSYLTQPATCFDNIQNQNETDVDKGGPCDIRDEAELKPVTVRFASTFPVSPGVYSALGYVENPNYEVGTKYARYRFSLYNSEGVLIGERDGVTFVPPQTTLPVFEALIKTGNQNAVRATLAFEPVTNWIKMPPYVNNLTVSDIQRKDLFSRPRITAKVQNVGLEYLRSVPVVVAVYDETGTVKASSRTTIDSIAKASTEDVVYTWPEPFAFAISRIDVIPVVFPESLKKL